MSTLLVNKRYLTASEIAMTLLVTMFSAVAPVTVQQATAATTSVTISPECAAAIRDALADRRITSSEIDAIKVACADSASEECVDTIVAAASDRKITRAELDAIRAACY